MKISLCLIRLNEILQLDFSILIQQTFRLSLSLDRPYKYLLRNYIFERIMILRNTIQTFKQGKVFILSVLMMVLDA